MIEVQPSGIVYSLSPAIYHLFDSNNGDTGFEYVLDVFIWSGHKITDKPNPASDTPNFTLTKLPNAEGYATYDISYLVRAALTPEEPNAYITNATGATNTTATHTQWVFVYASYWTDGSTRQGSASSNTQLAIRGWTPYAEGVNGTNQGASTFALAVSGQYIPRNVPFGFSVNTTAVDSVDFTSPHGNFTIDLSAADDNENQQKVQTIVCNAETTGYVGGAYKQRVLIDGGAVDDSYQTCIKNYLSAMDTLTITTKTTAGATIKTWTLNLACEPKYTPHFVAFLNRYGCWDYLPITLNNIQATQGKRSDYENRYLTPSADSVSYNTTQPTARIFNTGSSKSITLNTGYQPEEVFEYITDMVQSERFSLVSSDGTLQPLKLKDTQIQKQTEVNEKLINYTLSFDFATDVRNTMSI